MTLKVDLLPPNRKPKKKNWRNKLTDLWALSLAMMTALSGLALLVLSVAMALIVNVGLPLSIIYFIYWVVTTH